MKEPTRLQREFWLFVAAGSSLMLLTGAGAYWIKSNAERPQPTLAMAIADNAPPPAHAFAANDAVRELLESLPPDLALDVCANLTADLARTAKRPCDDLRQITVIAAAASPVPLGSAMAALPEDLVTTPRLAAGPVSLPELAPTLPTAPHGEPVPDIPATGLAAAPAPASAVVLAGVAAAGAPIASAQTTEQPAQASANGESGVQVTVRVEDIAPPAPAIARPEHDWFFLSGMPEGGGVNVDGPGEDAAADGDASAAAAAAEARARAAAEAEAEAKARAAARAKALARAVKANKESDGATSTGKGKDKDQGAGSSGGNADKSGDGHR
jgi:hypothetical protein